MAALKTAVTSFLGGDESAFNDIYTYTYRKVSLAAGTYLKNHADAEDAVQDIYIKLYEKLESLSDPAKAMPWIMTLARNTCLDRLNKLAKSDVTVFEDSEDSGATLFDRIEDERDYHSPETHALKTEKSAIVIEMVSMLPLEQKDAVLLHYIEKRSISEVADITNVTAGTVKSRLSYARKKLKELIEEREERDGVKLRMGGLFLFLPSALRFFYNTVTLSAETAAASLAGVEATLGITASTTAAVSVPTAAVATGGTVTAVLSANAGIAAVASIAVVACIGVGTWAVIDSVQAAPPDEPQAAVYQHETEETAYVAAADEIPAAEEPAPAILAEADADAADETENETEELFAGQVPEPTPEPTPPPTPEPTPSPTPEPAPEPTPTPAPEPTPEPTPTGVVTLITEPPGSFTFGRGPDGEITDFDDCSTHGGTFMIIRFGYGYNIDGVLVGSYSPRCTRCEDIVLMRLWACSIHGEFRISNQGDDMNPPPCPNC